jgi:hypothetical protein
MAKISDRRLAAELGISHTMVRKYRTRGMPTHSATLALAWLTQNSGGRFAKKEGARRPAPTVETAEDLETPEDDGPHAVEPNALGTIEMSQAELTKRLTAARIKLTNRDAAIRSLQERQAQMDADLRDGKLLRSEDESRKSSVLATALRNKLLALPAEWALQLAAISDPALVADFTRKRIKATLIEFCAAYGVTAESQ